MTSADPNEAPAPPEATPGSPGPPTAWGVPDASGLPRRQRRLLLGCLLVGALAIAAPLIALYIYEQSGSREPEVMSVGFGTGGSGCNLTNVVSTFPLGVTIRNVATYSPALQAGSTVTITVERNGAELVDLRDTINIEQPADCIYGTISPPLAGHYRVQYELSPSNFPPISGEFEVTS